MTAERCPGCRARLTEDPVCPRCGCDLTLVRRAQAQARSLLGRALRAWAEGNAAQARALAVAALALEQSALGRALLGCLSNAPAPSVAADAGSRKVDV